MTDFDERPPGPPLDQHMSFLISGDDRQPLLGLAAYTSQRVGRDVVESVFIRRALRIGTRELLDEISPAERAIVAELGDAALEVLAAKKRARRPAAPDDSAEQVNESEPARA
jgi:hypothetical protein